MLYGSLLANQIIWQKKNTYDLDYYIYLLFIGKH